MGIAFLVIGAVLLMITAILSQTLIGKWKKALLIVFAILLIAYTIVGIQMELDRKVEKGKEDTNISALNNKNKQIYDITQQLLQVVKSPNFAKNTETAKQIVKIEQKLSTITSPAKAELKFTFYPFIPPHTIKDAVKAPIEKGIVTVEVTVINVGEAVAGTAQGRGTMWIIICDECRFAEEPKGTENMQPYFINERRIPFVGLLPGTSLEPYELKVIPPPEAKEFEIGLKYGCPECLPVAAKPQILTVFIEQ
jgi:chorismate mutase